MLIIRLKGKQVQILYELVTVSVECKATNATEKLGRRPWMKIRKSGDLPVVWSGNISNGHE
jgi:hypothetical protein